MEVREFLCRCERCQFCQACHRVGECSFARPKCEMAQWASLVDVLQLCGYSVMVEQESGYVVVVTEMERVAFALNTEGLAAAEKWFEEYGLAKLIQQLDSLTRPSWWDVVKGWWHSLRGR